MQCDLLLFITTLRHSNSNQDGATFKTNLNSTCFSVCSALDEIILNYVATVLESLAQEPGALQDSFDVEEFCEMLEAYFPGFEKIPHSMVTEWICDLVTNIRKESGAGTVFSVYALSCVLFNKR